MSSHVAHHFDDAEQQFEAASLGMWVFLVTEVLFFGGLFTGYAEYRTTHAEGFALASGKLDVLLGTINTAVLLTSSLTMALAVRSAQLSDVPAVRRFLLATIGLGVAFLGIKGYEYYHKYDDHLVPGHSFQWHSEQDGSEETAGDPPGIELFFSFYFAMTGLHAMHMIIGIPMLGIIWWGAYHNRYSAEYYTPVENMGLYWHFVDIVWVFLFPLLYLVG